MDLKAWLRPHWISASQRILDGRHPHALLVCGPQGLGKRELVGALAARLLCQSPRGTDACGLCRACTLRLSGTHPDLQRIEFGLRDDGKPRTEITIDQIRELSARFAARPALGGWQVVVIDPADAMNAAAANGLLKTLEEPAADTALILVADQPARLPATIRSRCQRIEVKTPGIELASQWLQQQGVSGDIADEALQLADGNPGLALELCRDEAQQRLRAIERDLRAAASGAALLPIAQAWAEDEPELRLRLFAIRLVRCWHGLISGQPSGDALESTIQGADRGRLSELYDAINLCRVRLPTPLRKDLALLELLTAWREACVSR